MKAFKRPGDFAEPSAFVSNGSAQPAAAPAVIENPPPAQQNPPARTVKTPYQGKVSPTGSVKESIILPAKMRQDIQVIQDENFQDFSNAARSLILDGFKYRTLIKATNRD